MMNMQKAFPLGALFSWINAKWSQSTEHKIVIVNGH